MLTARYTLVLFALFIPVLFFARPAAAADSQPTVKLRTLYESNEAFRKNIDLMFANLKDSPDGKPNPWKGKNIEDLYHFVNRWHSFLPRLDNGLIFIREFQMLYFENPYGRTFVTQEPGLSWTRELAEDRARFMESAESLDQLQGWLDAPSIAIEDYKIPEGGFQSFSQFFVRELKPGARPIDRPGDDSVIVAPADCLMEITKAKLTLETPLELKAGVTLNVAALLDNHPLAKRFVGGTAVRCILEPHSYHHYHAPVSGHMVASKENVPGLYYDERVLSAVERYHRGYFIIKTARFGYVAMIPVGLATIGSVKFDEKFRDVTPEMNVDVFKGERLGHFNYGGSLVMLLFEPDRLSWLSTRQGRRIGVFEE